MLVCFPCSLFLFSVLVLVLLLCSILVSSLTLVLVWWCGGVVWWCANYDERALQFLTLLNQKVSSDLDYPVLLILVFGFDARRWTST